MRDLDANLRAAYERRLADLDQEHARARSPGARRHIEAKMREVRDELRKTIELSKKVDEAAAAWWKKTRQELAAVLGPDPKENDPNLH